MLSEKARSRAQQKLFGIVRSHQKGELENPSPEVEKIASTVSKSDVKKMASTKHTGLPEKKKIEEVAFLAAAGKVALAAGKGAVKQKAKQVIAQKAANVAQGAIPQPNRDQQQEGVGRAAIGAVLGSPLGPLGSAAGAAIGGALGTLIPIPGIGSLIGMMGGEYLGSLLYIGFMGGGWKKAGKKLRDDLVGLFSNFTKMLVWIKNGWTRFYKGIP